MSYTEHISLLDLTIQLDVLFESTIWATQEYRIPDARSVDFKISVSEEDILSERKLALESEQTGKDGYVSDKAAGEYCEMSAVLRKISEEIPSYDALTFHGCVVAVDNDAYMFTAKSGIGKSTHVALWQQLLKERAIVINGDKPFLRLIDETVYVYGSPWCGKEGLHTNCRKPLKAICFIEQDRENSITEMTLDEISGLLIKQCYMPCNHEKQLKSIQLLDRMSQHLRFYKMSCNMDISAAEMSYGFMKNS